MEPVEPEPIPASGCVGATAKAEDPTALDETDLRIGGYVAIAMFAAGAALLPVTALPIGEVVDSASVTVIGALSLALAGMLGALTRTGRVTPNSLYACDYAWISLTACVVAASGGRTSPFFLLYPVAVLHTAAFQSRGRTIVMFVVAVLAFLTPLAYDSGGAALFGAMATIAVPATLAVAWGMNVALTTLRRQRYELRVVARDAELLARSDPLTGLGNVRQLWSALDSETARARRHRGCFSLILIDLDGFKAINDEIGHRGGDAALRTVADVLRSEVRAEDLCCRHGGDEFSVIAIGASWAQAGHLAGRLERAIANVRISGDGELRLGAKAGWATFGEAARTADDLLRVADSMLLERKYGRRPDRRHLIYLGPDRTTG